MVGTGFFQSLKDKAEMENLENILKHHKSELSKEEKHRVLVRYAELRKKFGLSPDSQYVTFGDIAESNSPEGNRMCEIHPYHPDKVVEVHHYHH